MKLGARIIKTGVTLILAIYLSQMLDLGPVIYSAIAAALAIQPSVYRSLQYGIEQIQSNMVGATIAIIFSTYIGTHPIFVAIAIMLVIGINLQFHFERSIPLAMVTVLSIMEVGNTQGSTFLLFAVERFSLIFIGIVSALLVNALLFPPKYEQRLTIKLKNLEEQLGSLFRIILDSSKNEHYIRSKLNDLEAETKALWDLYNFEKEAKRSFKRKIKFSPLRKLVVLKNMLETAEVSLQLLRIIEKYQNTIQYLPEELLKQIKLQLTNLANYQDKIYSKYEGKLYSSVHHSRNNELVKAHWDIYQKINEYIKQPDQIIEVLVVLSFLGEYNKHLDHLDKLIDSYHSHHKQTGRK